MIDAAAQGAAEFAAPGRDTSAKRESVRGIGQYARYWVETLKLPHLDDTELDRRFSYVDFDRILDVLDSGHTPIMVLPHLGSWEWAAAWLTRIAGQRVAAVVERLEDEELFEWFVSLRQAYGVEVVPLGPRAMADLLRIVDERAAVVCLLADRDIAGSGVDVSFFGRPTKMPGGPALVALRSGSPLLPVAIYDEGPTRLCRIGEPIWPERTSSLRADVHAMTQAVAHHLEGLIALAPHQWHVLEPIWETRS